MRDEDVIPMNCMILTSIVLASRLEDSVMLTIWLVYPMYNQSDGSNTDITGPWDPDSIRKMKKLKNTSCEMEITFPNNRFCDLTLNVLETEQDSSADQAIIKYNKVDNVLNV
ncbi:conserved hypothetical protein [Theileria orientalis strain Shintoku]|uniref:Uncharacterized protein n=1 Tax=Theileria orientalis strain Shintoku TaxID=869250 RepID=J4C312_THEOR|nr:conserved hypothetical protein [Theileria orientalis strain Shintoku]BAM39636.1 conserved hypothetical protein [Theileria orientalis strain Shintoku]|eukprot:XP_009689937.1 conserved hypothetical protein [Theileria orientalis strain Shintoku]